MWLYSHETHSTRAGTLKSPGYPPKILLSWTFPVSCVCPYSADMGSYSPTAPVDQSRSQTIGSVASQAFLGFEPYVAAEEAAAYLKVTPRRVKDMARAGAIPAHPVDPNAERKEWRFLLSELSAWMRNNSAKKRGI